MPVALCTNFDASQLRKIARKTKDGTQARRLLALASIYDGSTRRGCQDRRCDLADRVRLVG